MFTGIIEEKGTIRSVRRGAASASLVINASLVISDVRVGDSINTNGVCLTVTAFDTHGFEVDVMAETLRRTNLGALSPGSVVNLERALRLSDRLGGHMVSGHIDGTGTVIRTDREDNATVIRISAPPEVLRYIVSKGSVALDGISLTVVGVDDKAFSVSIIPHTGAETTLLEKKRGDTVNIECDITGKYIEKLMTPGNKGGETKIDLDFLHKHGYTD